MMAKHLAKLGDSSNIASSMEGIVFEYPPGSKALYKLTGAFAPLNQIIGGAMRIPKSQNESLLRTLCKRVCRRSFVSRRLIKKWIREHLILEVAATASQIFKDPDRVANYLDQIKKGTPFELVAGGTVIIPAKENAALVSALESFDKIAF